MTRSKLFKCALAACAIFLTSSAFADIGWLHLSSPVNAAGERLPAGEYTVQWKGPGASVELKIMQGKKILATIPAIVTNLNDTSINDALIITVNRDGSQHLSQIFFSGKKSVLRIEQQSGIMPGNRIN